jgi:hypothetical protein
VGVIERQPTGGKDARNVRVQPEFLIPGVRPAEEADFRAEMSGGAGNFQKSFRTAWKQ